MYIKSNFIYISKKIIENRTITKRLNEVLKILVIIVRVFRNGEARKDEESS